MANLKFDTLDDFADDPTGTVVVHRCDYKHKTYCVILSGDTCATNINDCADDPCDVTGTVECQDLVADFFCLCNPGYTGKNCSVSLSPALPIYTHISTQIHAKHT